MYKKPSKESVIKSLERHLQGLERISSRCDWTAEIVDRFIIAHAAVLDIQAALEALPADFTPPDRPSTRGASRNVIGRYVRPKDAHANKYLAIDTNHAIFPPEGLRVLSLLGNMAIIETPNSQIRAPIVHFEVIGGFGSPRQPPRSTLKAGDRVIPKEPYADKYLGEDGESIFPEGGLRVTGLAGSQATIETEEEKIHIPVAHLQLVETPTA